ncbi:hypothetical protein RKE29_16155 [Streptomyces sp. B1866]|uniref:hypothetical protein n=1 Tax=Streptomyces sp. B1866 TaxID=3075431 RepID=UPI00288E0777|nr:hypothetical protein [Streptomyces sp. B1866]MDT3398157.1 hypothetical protein [Streptomyces sp. B1866]
MTGARGAAGTAEGRPGARGFDAAEWLLAASDEPGEVRLRWASGDGLADLPVGRAFDLVRMTDDLGTAVIQALHRRDAAVGPVMLATASHVVSFLVPPGAADQWRRWLAGTPYERRRTVAAAGPGRVLRCPRPGTVRAGHVWLVQPAGRLTDSSALRAALRDSADPAGPAAGYPLSEAPSR